MQQERVPDVRALARAQLLLKRYSIPLDGSGDDLLSRQHNALEQQIDEQPPYQLQEAWIAEGKLGICPQFFVAEMFQHWVGLGNVVTRKLEKLWGAMAETFNGLLAARAGDPWLILSPETGTGKTQGSCAYAALSGLYTGTGILFTTRLTSQCDSVVRDIQRIAENHRSRYPKGRRFGVSSSSIAVTIHSDQSPEERPSEEVIHNAPCLVVTHELMKRIYKENLENGSFLSERASIRFDKITKWRNGLRIRITDETPSGLVEHFKMAKYTFSDLMYILRPQVISGELTKEAREQLELVTCIEKAFYAYWGALKDTVGHDGAKVVTLGDFLPTDHKPAQFTLEALFKAVREASDHSQADIDSRKDKAIKALLALQHVAHSWAVAISNVGRYQIVTSARLIVPPDDMPMCVLDATASTTPLWRVLETRVKPVDIERNIRDYRNVTAHLCYLKTGGVGKDASKKEIKARLAEVFRYFKDEAPQRDRRRKVLICLPLDVKKNTKELAVGEDGVTALRIPEYLEDLKVGHWNAIDGRNDFRDCDTVVILSWQYPPANLPIDLLFAATDPSNRNDSYLKETKNLRKELELGHVGASVIQAVNRVRCRKVTAEDGSCEPTDIFMLMPNARKDAQTMRETLEREMPNMVFRDWDILKPTGERKPRVKEGSQVDRFLTYLNGIAESVESIILSEAFGKLQVKDSGQKDIRKKLNDPESDLCKHIAAMGWTYSSRQCQRYQPILTRTH